jgi:hypothetical protein
MLGFYCAAVFDEKEKSGRRKLVSPRSEIGIEKHIVLHLLAVVHVSVE